MYAAALLAVERGWYIGGQGTDSSDGRSSLPPVRFEELLRCSDSSWRWFRTGRRWKCSMRGGKTPGLAARQQRLFAGFIIP